MATEVVLCCLCDHCISPVFQKEKESPLDRSIVKTGTTKHIGNSCERLSLSEPNDNRMFCGWMMHQLMRCSVLSPLQSLYE
jgi:hypothetical protein